MKYHLNFRKISFTLLPLLALMSFTVFANYFAYSSKMVGGIKKISSENESFFCAEHLDDCEGSINGEEGLCIDEVPNRALRPNVESEDDALSDSDGDEIDDLTDIDDDNDGIVDATESPSCFYTAGDFEVGDRSSLVTVTTGLNMHTSYNAPQELVDGDAGTATSSYAVDFINSQSNEGSNIYTFQFEAPVELANVYVQYINGNSHFINGAVVKLQGSYDGNNWVDLNTGATYNQSNTSGTVLDQGTMHYHVFSVAQNSSRYYYYRIKGVSGSIWSSGISNEVYFEVHSGFHASRNPKGSCITDTDNDSTLNHHDLDSDGDGCSDSYEAGAIASETPDHQYNTSGGGDGNGDGLADVVDDGSNGGTVLDGIPDYEYRPYAYLSALNLCRDTDNDGMADIMDIDDDNDGIINATESPDCYYTAGNFEVGNRSSFVTVTTGLNMHTSYNAPQELVDGDAGTATSSYAVDFINSQSNEGSNIYTFQFEAPVELANVYVQYINGNSHFINGAVVKLQGSYDGNNWVDLNTGATYNQSNTSGTVLDQGTMHYHVFSVAQNSSRYYYYRIKGVSGSIWSSGISNEVYFEVHSGFHASRNPKGSCITDTDNDSTLNHHDLDSDGDGCSDSYEAGAIASESANHQYNTSGGGDGNGDGLADVVDDGSNGGTALDGIPDYKYTPYAYSDGLNLCADTDNDGMADITDIDDDNDGIVNATESPNCFYSEAEATQITSISTDISPYSNHYITYAIDGDPSTYSALASDVGAVGDVLFHITPQVPIQLDKIEYDPINWGITNSTDRAKLQGYNGAIWEDLTGDLELTATTGTVSIENTLHPNTVYSAFRLIISAASNYYAGIIEIRLVAHNYNASLNPKTVCTTDIDNDNTLNHLDLDSDGDGCSDSYEAGAIASETANHQFNTSSSGDANADGLADVVDDGSNGGTALDGIPDYEYRSYAYLSALNLCRDTDNDGKGDLTDIDDDNDGIVDATESPSCFYTAGDFEVGDRSSLVTVTTGLNMHTSYNAPQELVDGDAGTATSSYAVDFINSQSNEGSNIYTFQFEAPVELANVYVQYINGNSHFINGAVVKLQGSYDGNNWVDLNTGATYNQSNTSGTVLDQGTMHYHVFSVAQNSSRYYYYRIKGVSGSIWSSGIANEVYFEVHSGFHASRNPKGSCITDTDNDSTLNHQDLDSDGDGCSDSYEAGAIASETPDHQYNTSGGGDGNGDGLADVVDDGSNGGTALDGMPDYKYTPYAYSDGLNLCADTDNDGMADITDIDDDNDGILDTDECTPNEDHTKEYKKTFDFNSSSDIADWTSYGVIETPKHSADTDGDVTNQSAWTNSRIPSPDNSEFITSKDLGGGRGAFQYPHTISETTVVEIPGGVNRLSFDMFNAATSGIDADLNYQVEIFTEVETITLTGSYTEEQKATLNGEHNAGATAWSKAPGWITLEIDLSNSVPFTKLKGIRIYVENITGSSNSEVMALDNVAFYTQHDAPICDSDVDNDGILNHHDLDSDGDGCPDALEGGGDYTSMDFVTSSIDGGNTGSNFTGNPNVDPIIDNLGNTVDTNGVPVIADGGQSVGSSEMKDVDEDGDGLGASCDCYDQLGSDTDGDGVPDYADVDSDNDGLSDAVENPNNAEPALDTDGDLIPNYRDSDSDNDGIPDAIEACDGVDYTMLSVSDCRLPFDDTIVDTAGCQTGVTTSPCNTPLNTDAGEATGDTIPDYLDLDSDGDDCSDSQESFGIEVTGTNISTYDGSISVDGSTGLTTSIMCDTIITADENKNGLPMYRDTDENICVYPNRDFGDLSTNNNRYAELYARQYADANNDFKPEGDSAVWLGSKVDFEGAYASSFLADGDDNDAEGDDEDGLEITVAAPSTGTDRTGVWTVTANGNTSGTKVYISLRIDWNNDETFADYTGVKEIYMTSIVIGSPTSKAITIAYPDSYDGTSNGLNVRLVGGKTRESANMVSGRLVDGEVEDYFFTSSALLPIEFLSFTAEADGFDGLLEWEATSELHNSHFEIERSVDGYVFNKIGQVEGKGSATEVERYAFTDVGVGKYVTENVYYRLKQVYMDGGYKYSSQEVISFRLSGQMEIEIYPNPVREELYIHMRGQEDDREIRLQICGTQGKVLLTRENFRGGMVKVGDLSPGVYMLKFTEGGKTVEYMKCIKM